MMNEDATNVEDQMYPKTYGNEMSYIQVPKTQENVEGYDINTDDKTRPSNEFTHEYICAIILQQLIMFKIPRPEFNNEVEEDIQVLHKDLQETLASLLRVLNEEVVRKNYLI